MTYEDRFKLLNWDTLKKRKTYQTLVKCYKTPFNLNGMSFHEVLDCRFTSKTRVNHNTRFTTNYRDYRLLQLSTFPFVRIINCVD